jgi:MIP family channel proteins
VLFSLLANRDHVVYSILSNTHSDKSSRGAFRGEHAGKWSTTRLSTTRKLNTNTVATQEPKPSLRERVPFTKRNIPEWTYNTLVATFAEFIGTTFFLFFALAGCQVAYTNTAASIPARTAILPSALLYAALSVGFSLVVNAWVFFRVTSGLFNPAITLGMCLVGSLPWSRGACIAISQLLAGMTAAGLVSCVFPGELRAETLLGSRTSVVRGFFIEALLSAAFVFSVFMLAAEKHKGTFIAPIGIGLALFVAQLVGGPFTGASLNPARSFGAAVASHHFPGYHWIYWIGPLAGSLLGAGFYKVVKVLEAELALALKGPDFLGHRRGVSNSSAVLPSSGGHRRSQSLPKEIHTLEPVPESDLEKGVRTEDDGDGDVGIGATSTDDSRESGHRVKRDVEVV